MKLASALGLFSLASTALAFNPSTFDFVGNVDQDSMFIVGFRDDGRIAETKGGQVLKFDLQVPQGTTSYSNMVCKVQLDINGLKTIRNTSIRQYEAQTPGYNAFEASYTLTPTELLKEFELFCSFRAPVIAEGAYTSSVKVNYGDDEADTAINVNERIRFFSGSRLARTSTMYISKHGSSFSPTTFNFHLTEARTKSITVTTPNPERATFGTDITFGPKSSRTDCDVYWDNVLYKGSAIADVSSNGVDVVLELGSDLDVSKDVQIECPKLYGYKYTDGLPSILTAYSGNAANFVSVSYNSAASTAMMVAFIATFTAVLSSLF